VHGISRQKLADSSMELRRLGDQVLRFDFWKSKKILHRFHCSCKDRQFLAKNLDRGKVERRNRSAEKQEKL